MDDDKIDYHVRIGPGRSKKAWTDTHLYNVTCEIGQNVWEGQEQIFSACAYI